MIKALYYTDASPEPWIEINLTGARDIQVSGMWLVYACDYAEHGEVTHMKIPDNVTRVVIMYD